MAATAFAIIMLGAFVFGLGCFIGGIVLFKFTKNENKVLNILSVILGIWGILCIAFPIGWIMFLRIANGMVEEDYVDTGVMITWDSENSFTYNDTKYISCDLYDELGWYSVDCGEEQAPAFNIKRKGDFWSILFNAYEKEVMYEIQCGTGDTLYYCGELYCPKDATDRIKEYFSNDAIFEWYVSDDDYDKKMKIELTEEEQKAIHNTTYEDADNFWDASDKYSQGYLMKVCDEIIITEDIDIIKCGELWSLYIDEIEVDDSGKTKILSIELPKQLSEKIDEAMKAF